MGNVHKRDVLAFGDAERFRLESMGQWRGGINDGH